MRRVGNRAVSWLVAAAVMAMLSPVSMAFAAVNNDEVTSVKLKEADGTSGQNTNTGSGVKTGHIQDGAVTSIKIGAGAVTAGNIADGSVTDAKITGTISGAKLGAHGHSGGDITDGSIPGSKLAPASVTANSIADGAVSDGKISGPVYGHKIYYQGVLTVDPNYPAGGFVFTTINEAMTYASAAWPNTNTVIKIMPGTYHEDLDLTGKYVTLEGVQGKYTMLDGTLSMPTYSGAVTLRHLKIFKGISVSGQLELDDVTSWGSVTAAFGPLTVKNSTIASGQVSGLNGVNISDSRIENGWIGLAVYGAFNSKITNTVVNSPAGTDSSISVSYYTLNPNEVNSQTVITNVKTSGALNGFKTYGPYISPRIINSDLSGTSYGVNVSESNATILNSSVSGNTAAVYGWSGNARIIGSQLSSPVIAGSPAVKLVNCYDVNYDPIANQ